MGDGLMPLFSVHVRIRQNETLKSDEGQINMILFDGFVDAPFFNGEILPGACDTQKYFANENGMLSARYMLSGKDENGSETKVFIENNATFINGQWKTVPFIMTDNPRLSWLTKEKLKGEIEGVEGGVIIHFYREEKK